MARVKVNVRLFATLRERAGASSIDIELPDCATVDDALAVLRERGELADALDRLPVRLAVNREYAQPGAALRAGDEVALITPVSGGS